MYSQHEDTCAQRLNMVNGTLPCQGKDAIRHTSIRAALARQDAVDLHHVRLPGRHEGAVRREGGAVGDQSTAEADRAISGSRNKQQLNERMKMPMPAEHGMRNTYGLLMADGSIVSFY